MAEATPRKGSRFPLIIGVAAFAGGLWLFLNAQGVGVPPFKTLWPSLLILGGVAALADYLFLSRRASSTGWALAWFGFGILFFALTLEYTNWRKILDWLPSFPTIIGLSMLTSWLADRKVHENLVVPGGLFLTIGILGYAARFDWLKRLLPSAQFVWAVMFLSLGGYLIWRAIARARN
jgi:hypothetical protein